MRLGSVLRMPPGVLGILAMVVGLPLGLITAGIVQLSWGTNTYISVAVVCAMFLVRVIEILERVIFREIWFESFLEAIVGGGIFFVIVYAGYVDSNGFQYSGMQDITSVIGWIIFLIAIPALSYEMPSILWLQYIKLLENPNFRNWFSFGQGGNARWAGPYTYEKRTPDGGILLGATMVQDTLLKSRVAIPKSDDAHHVTIAMTGAGKSITCIWPTLKTYKGPMLVIDPKGEHAEFSVKKRGRQFKSRILDPFEKVYSEFDKSKEPYNPLAEIDISRDNARALIQAISTACVMDEKSDIHFSESAKTIIEGVIALVLSTRPQEQQNLPAIADMFRGFDDELGVADPSTFDHVIAEMTTCTAAGGLSMDAAGLLVRAADRERGSMMTTCFRSLKWVNDPPMRRHLLGYPGYPNHQQPQLIRNLVTSDEQSTLYVVLPFEYMEKTSQIRWMRMMINLVGVHLFQNPRSSDKHRLIMVMDEFFKLGYMPSLEQGVVTARGAGAKYWILLQDIGQLKSLYKANWETFLGSSNVQVFGINDSATVQWTAAALGGMKEGNSDNYPLMRPDEVSQFLGKDAPTQIVIPATGAPMRLERMAYKPINRYRGIGLR